MHFDLRPAREHDRELLWLIQSTSMRPPVEATWGWDEAFQRALFEERADDRPQQIIRVDGSDAGELSVEIHGDHVFLKRIALLPQFQGQGLGSRMVREVMDQAMRLGLPVRLQVLKANRARRLYERLGFRPYAETATHVQMVFEPEAT